MGGHRTRAHPRALPLPALLALVLAGCATAELPYEYRKVRANPAPVHPLRVAVLPLADARSLEEGPEDRERFVFQDLEYRATDLRKLGRRALDRLSEILARHLAAARVFAQVILVTEAEQAPEADLLLEAKVYRMRGYVEAVPPAESSGRPKDERYVLAEVVLRDVVLRDARSKERRVFASDAGWSVFEPRRFTAEPDPWAVLGEALFVAVSDLAKELEAADLSGGFLVIDEVELELPVVSGEGRGRVFGDLGKSPPAGWAFTSTSTTAGPVGWKGRRACEEASITQRQTRRFSRFLGPYRPTVLLWACPLEERLAYDARVDFPAELLGESDRARYFGRALGETNWPGALAQVAAHLDLRPPARRHVFDVGPEHR